MKRLLLLLLFLFPAILLAQKEQKQSIDSTKDVVANIQSIYAAAGNGVCTRAANIRITNNATDSGEFVTIIVFSHRITALDSANFDTLAVLPPSTIVKINQSAQLPGTIGLISSFPELPAASEELIFTMLPIRPIVSITVSGLQATEVSLITSFPPLPLIFSEDSIVSMTPIAILNLSVEGVAMNPLELITNMPRQPIIKEDSIGAALPSDITTFNIPDVRAADSLSLITDFLPLPLIIEDTVLAIPTLELVTMAAAPRLIPDLKTITDLPRLGELRTSVDEMHLSSEGYSLLQKMEGYSPGLYSLNDGGYTIGFGIFVPFNEGYKFKNGITWEEAERLMEQKMPAYEDQVKKYVNVPITQSEFDALTMLAYNLGGFSKATSIINDINNQVGFDKLQADWKRFVHSKAPNVSKGLMNRRKDELDVKKVSNYQPERKIQVLKTRK